MDRRLLGEAGPARVPFALTLLFSLLGGLLVIGQALLLSRIIARLFLDGAPRDVVLPLFGQLLLLVALRAATHLSLQVAAAALSARVKSSLRRRFLDGLLALGPAFAGQERSGELALAATEGIAALDRFFRDYLPALIAAVLIPAAILVVVFPLDLLTFVVLLLTAPLIPIFMWLIGQAAGRLARRKYAQLGQLSAHFLDVMQGLTTLKLFNRSRAQLGIIARLSDQYRRESLAVLRVAFLSAFVLELVATISTAVVAVEIGLRLLYGRILFEQALFLLVIAPEFYAPLRQLGAGFHAGQDGAAAAARIYAVVDAPRPPAGGAPVPPYEAIRFAGVGVSFAAGTRPALRDFTLTIRRGEHVALVGATGSGKSTVANLLLRFVAPDAGEILLLGDGGAVPLADVDPLRWRAQIGWVPQRGYLFNGDVADNLRLGRADLLPARLQAAARSAAADGFIQALPNGYATPLGENGARLSGGQAQRLALARALLGSPPLYIFDEATANLDRENERRILENLRTATAGATVITIAHRLETVREADRIVVLDGGRIAEQGTHEALLARQGAYFALLQVLGGADG